MSYLPSGTTYPAQLSDFEPGLSQKGQDYVAQVITGTGSLTTVAGVSQDVVTSIINHAYSGAAIYVLGAFSPTQVEVNDVFGGAAGANIIVSGTGSNVVINGAATSSISTAFGSKTFYNWSGNSWIAS